MRHALRVAVTTLALIPTLLAAQTPQTAAPPQGQRGGGAVPKLAVTSTAWPDGGEIPMKYAFRGENKSPAFDFQWFSGTTPAAAPATLQSYAIIFHDVENASMRGPVDTLHWILFNIPGTATGVPEGLGPGDLPDGTINGAGLSRRNNNPGSYFGPGPGPGPYHHYVFEFYALDITLSLPGTATRDQILKAMEGHVVGKSAYFGRFKAPNPSL